METPKQTLQAAMALVQPPYMAHHGYGEKRDWEMLWIMGHGGASFARVYWLHDSPETICLDNLGVMDEQRRKGIGTELQELREAIGRKLGATQSVLWVGKGTWQQAWYERRGYTAYQDHQTQENAVWMRKAL